jgi:23S rRNA pseudouridine1911/1915/1917 synthase
LNTLEITPELAGATLAAVLRQRFPERSWSTVRQLVAARRVRINTDLCLDPARRLQAGDSVEVLDQPLPKLPAREDIVIRHLDRHVVVVEKPAGIATVRHPAERAWTAQRRALVPTLDDLVLGQIRQGEKAPVKGKRPRLRIVHRLDKETSGLVVFARTVDAERGLGKQFKEHTVIRRYLAIVRGHIASKRIESRLVRDRGDGRRGSSTLPGLGKTAVTHVEVLEALPGYTLLCCRLETGRTHQIRIHLSELGHPVCGDKVYRGRPAASPQPDSSGAPRLALHAAELGFRHPLTGETMLWSMPLPADLQNFLERLRAGRGQRANHMDGLPTGR